MGSIDTTLFMKNVKGNILLVQIYVDVNILDSQLKVSVGIIQEYDWWFYMSMMGQINYFQGL